MPTEAHAKWACRYKSKIKWVKWTKFRQFAHKAYAFTEAVIDTDADVVIWLDADVVIRGHVDKAWVLRNVYKDWAVATFMDKSLINPRKHVTETGFLLFNRRHPACIPFVERIRKVYDTDEMFRMDEWHDGWVFEQVVDEFEEVYDFFRIRADIARDRSEPPSIDPDSLESKLVHDMGSRKTMEEHTLQDR